MNYLLSHSNKIPSWDKMGFDVFHNEGYWLHRKGSLAPFDIMPDNAHEDEITARLIGIHIQDLNETIATQTAVIEAQSERVKELMGVLKQIALNAPKSNDEINQPIHHNTVKNHALNFVYAGLLTSIAIKPLEESEDDNG